MRASIVSILSAAAVYAAGLSTHERVYLALIVASIALGVGNVVVLGRQAKAIKDLQQKQSQRIDDLPHRPGG